MKFRTALATAATACFSTAALADDEVLRLPALQIQGSSEATRLENPRELLTLIDGAQSDRATTSGKQLRYSVDGLGTGLTFDVTRVSSGVRPSHRGEGDRYKVNQVGVTGRLPVSNGLDLLVSADVAYMTRHVGAVPASYGKGKTYAARAGVGLGGKNWSLTPHYEAVTSTTNRRPMQRMAELLGGAPARRKGVAVALDREVMLSSRNRLSLRLNGRAIRRAQRDLELIGVAGTGRSEKQALLSATLSF